MDVDAGRIAPGEPTIEEMGWELFRTMLDVASGRRCTWTGKWGRHNSLALFNPAPVT
jgi:galactarate dehydratase